jgi:peptide/nickel transport system substrate-binding protein
VSRWTGPVVALALGAAACTAHHAHSTGPSSVETPIPRGGTLRIVAVSVPASTLDDPTALDPQKDYFTDSWELFRCCLLRTLLSYKGVPTAEGGAILHPDLATSMPTVSDDGLTWTFRLKPGLHYAPPLQNVEIKAQDIIRALEREANPTASAGGYSFYYSVIEGFDAYAAGQADSISGLEAPDAATLRVHLVRPTGDLGERFALAATAPIPANPADPSAPFGVATGHEDAYGPFLVSSGPYMLEGSERLDFSEPPDRQEKAPGLIPGKAIILVRNPTWDRRSDDLRGAYVDRIEVSVGGTNEDAARAIDEGRFDLTFPEGPYPQAPLDQVRGYQADPSKGIVSVQPRDAIRFVALNLAVPPLDDVHVRKAMNLVVNKARLQEIWGGPASTEVIGHAVLNSLENNLLLNYDPYATPGHAGDVDAARKEMALSKYDTDGDGMCDAPACSHLLALGFDASVIAKNPELSKEIQRDFRAIGIGLDLQLMPPSDMFRRASDPANHVALVLTYVWGKDYLNASTYLASLFSGATAGNVNFSLLGARPQQLRKWGYGVTKVPSVDDRIDSCLVQLGEAQRRCWADLDQYIMENVAPIVPYFSESQVQVVPRRIVRYSYDQFGSLPAPDQIALRPGS